MLCWWAHCRARNTYTRTSLTSKTPTHTQHKESVPSLLHSPSGLAFPSSAIQGLWRRKLALYLCLCGFQTHKVYQANQAPIPAPHIVRRPTIALMQSFSCYSLTGKITPKQIIQSLRPCIPFQCYSGVVEKKSNPIALSVWFPNTPGLSKQAKPPSLLPTQSRD